MSKFFLNIIFATLVLNSCRPNTGAQEAVRFNNIAISYAKQNIDSAIYYFDKAIQMDSNYLLAYQNKANVLIAAKQYNEALQEVNILSSKVANSETYKMKGLLYALTNDSIKAKENYIQAIEHIDEEVKRVNDFLKYQKLFHKGTIYLLLNQNKEGIDLIEKYSKKTNIASTRKDSIVTFQNDKEELIKILIQP